MKVNVMSSISFNSPLKHSCYQLLKKSIISLQCQFLRQAPPRNILQQNNFISISNLFTSTDFDINSFLMISMYPDLICLIILQLYLRYQCMFLLMSLMTCIISSCIYIKSRILFQCVTWNLLLLQLVFLLLEYFHDIKREYEYASNFRKIIQLWSVTSIGDAFHAYSKNCSPKTHCQYVGKYVASNNCILLNNLICIWHNMKLCDSGGTI